MTIRPELPGLYFILEVARVQTVFQTCSGLGSTSEVIEHKTTDQYGKEIVQKIPGRLRWTNLVLERGFDKSTTLWTWRQQVVDGKYPEARKNGLVTATNQDASWMKRWEFINGWPCVWQVSSTEDASGIVIERVEIAYDSLRPV